MRGYIKQTCLSVMNWRGGKRKRSPRRKSEVAVWIKNDRLMLVWLNESCCNQGDKNKSINFKKRIKCINKRICCHVFIDLLLIDLLFCNTKPTWWTLCTIFLFFVLLSIKLTQQLFTGSTIDKLNKDLIFWLGLGDPHRTQNRKKWDFWKDRRDLSKGKVV